MYLKLQPYPRRSLAGSTNEKLAPCYFGPYPIIQRIGPVAYKLELPETTSIHLVFHVSQLKKALGDGVKIQPLPPMLNAELEWVVEPEKVLAVRPSAHSPFDQNEILVKWRGLLEFEASWEPIELISKQFPDFHLEDKVFLRPGGNDRAPVQLTYSRRRKLGVD